MNNSSLFSYLITDFLIKAGLEKESFISTSTVSAVIVDVTRLLVFGLSFYMTKFAKIAPATGGLIVAAILATFVGSFSGTRPMKKVTLRTIQIIVGLMLILVGAGMASGLF